PRPTVEAPEAEAEAPARRPEAEPVIEEAPEPVVEAPVPPAPRFRDRLGKARGLISGYVGAVLSRTAIDDDVWDELEEALVRADVGVNRAVALLDDLRARVKSQDISTPDALVDALKADLKTSLATGDRGLRFERGAPNVWLFVGVNGVGKTTTIGKVGLHQAAAG